MKGLGYLKDKIKAIKYRTWDIVDLDTDPTGNITIKGMTWKDSFLMFFKGGWKEPNPRGKRIPKEILTECAESMKKGQEAIDKILTRK